VAGIGWKAQTRGFAAQADLLHERAIPSIWPGRRTNVWRVSRKRSREFSSTSVRSSGSDLGEPAGAAPGTSCMAFLNKPLMRVWSFLPILTSQARKSASMRIVSGLPVGRNDGPSQCRRGTPAQRQWQGSRSRPILMGLDYCAQRCGELTSPERWGSPTGHKRRRACFPSRFGAKLFLRPTQFCVMSSGHGATCTGK